MRSLVLWLLVSLSFLIVVSVSTAVPSRAFMPEQALNEERVIDTVWQFDAPVIDGDLSDWDTFEHHLLDKDTADYPIPAYRPEPDDLSAWTSIVWDNKYLYIALYVVDDEVIRASRNWYTDDMAGFSFDIDLDGKFGLSDLSYTISPDGLITLNGGWRLGTIGKTGYHNNGWQAEVAIPLREFGSDFLTDAQVGFTWGVQDYDIGSPSKYLVWSGPTFSQPNFQQGLLRFVNGPTREWLTIRPGVDNYDGITDATLNSWLPDQNNGNDTEIMIRSTNRWHVALKFEPPQLPFKARALNAYLHMNFIDRSAPSWLNVAAYRLMRPWDEDAVTWTNADAATVWARAGADEIDVDRSDYLVDSVVVDDINTEFVWDLSSEIADIYEHPENNHGFVFRAEEAGANMEYTLQASECGPTCAPWLEILIELPPPAPSPTQTPIPSPTPSPTITPTPTRTRTPTPTASPTTSPTPTLSPTPTESPTSTPTTAPTASPTPTLTPTESPDATPTPNYPVYLPVWVRS